MKQSMKALRIAMMAITMMAAASSAMAGDLFDEVEHHFADSGGVKIHYVKTGEGPVILFVHGFPNWWYDWRNQMEALRGNYTCVAMDTRGYNQSDQPQEVEAFTMDKLVGDVVAVIDALGAENVTLVGHDWGGAISWQVAMQQPARVNKLVIFNLTHPNGYLAVRRNGTPQQKTRMQYIERFQSPEANKMFTPEMLAGRYRAEPAVQERYLEAYRRSSFNSMLNYYRAIWPTLQADETPETPQLTMPVLQFHGLKDFAVDKDGLRDTWNWIDRDYTLVTAPDAGHDPHHEAAELVNATMKWWLASRP